LTTGEASIVAVVPEKKSAGRRPARPRSPRTPRATPPAQDNRAQLAKQGRLWLLSLVCALAGAFTVGATNSLASGVTVFLLCVTVLGGMLLWYERRRR
jgi:Flp pilus assembly protein TadB